MEMSYFRFLFNDDGSLKPRYAPVLTTNPDSTYTLKYSIPGYHTPRQYFRFSEIPQSFPNPYISDIFRFFSVSESLLFRNPHNYTLRPKKSIIRKNLGLKRDVRSYDEQEVEIAKHNLALAVQLGRNFHSLFFFDYYLEAYKILNPQYRYSKKRVDLLLSEFNRLIS